MSVIVDFSIFPMDKGISVSPYVARAVKIIRESGLAFQVGPMGTSIEGEWADAIRVVGRCMDALTEDCDRVYMTLKVDYRKNTDERMAKKVKAIENRL